MSILSFPQRTYLMAYDLDGSKLYDRTRAAFLVHAAALTELILRGLVRDDGGHPQVVTGPPSGDLVLDELLSEMAVHRRSWKSWLRHHCKQSRACTEAALDETGAITITGRRLGGRCIVTVSDTTAVKVLQAEVTAVLSGDLPTVEVSPADAALAVLAVTGGVRPVLPPRASRRGNGHVRELAARLDTAAHPLGQLIPSLRMTMVAAQGGMGGS